MDGGLTTIGGKSLGTLVKSGNGPIQDLVDMETGFGDPSHVYHAVEDFASAGISAIHMEDEVYPKRPSYLGGTKRVVDEHEMVKRIEAAVKSREDIDNDIVIVARCDAGRGGDTGTFEDAIERANSYYEAGAEATIVFPDDLEEMEYAVDHATGPLVHFQTDHGEDAPSVEAVGDIGFAMVVTPISSSIAAAKFMGEFYEDLYRREEFISSAKFDALDEVVSDSYELDDYMQIDDEADIS